ncbi:M48 family metalloprotease [Psychrobacter sp. I-STPA6b]|uniref:M48 family metalloprotease n=1 Tax=Psychrobacter sp. I-STPA6b TaxID=2585718 RepID=UPI001D0C580F|nr:M48 family metalloprotease [Psychrobacter sp. I-STPA6b]
MMDFFSVQEYRTKRSLRLYGLFFLMVFLHVAVAVMVVWLILSLFDASHLEFWLIIATIILALASFISSSWIEWQRLSDGGRAVARRVGAVRLFVDNSQDNWQHSSGDYYQPSANEKVRYTHRHIAVRNPRDFPDIYRRFYEFSEQMAIASGITPPLLYVLPDEMGINGFVAGRHDNDTVLVVTQGALEKLSDEGLYGLIGHEFGHILHGDAKFNLHLMVVLAGLQLLYDWSDPIEPTTHRLNGYYDMVERQRMENVPQSLVNTQAQKLQQETQNITSPEQWVAFWRGQGHGQPSPLHQYQQQHQITSHRRASVSDLSKPIAHTHLGAMVLQVFSLSGMLSAQLIKHSFNREREFLADATSVQLTRSPAILETLETIFQDNIGSRLINVPETNGLSHFFFASCGLDVAQSSWFSTHPPLDARMSAINQHKYEQFAQEISKQKRIKQKLLKEIYEQRKSGTWNELKTPSTSPDKELHFAPKPDVIVDGRLQVEPFEEAEQPTWLETWQGKKDHDLPETGHISVTLASKVCLPQYLLNQYHHPLGTIAFIEALMLCHQNQRLDPASRYDFIQIWAKAFPTAISNSTTKTTTETQSPQTSEASSAILPHRLELELLQQVAKLDRRMDSAWISILVAKLSKYQFDPHTLAQLTEQGKEDPFNYQTQKELQKIRKYQQTYNQYQQGLLTLLQTKLNKETFQKANINTLWQALHLNKMLIALSQCLGQPSQPTTPIYHQTYQNLCQSLNCEQLPQTAIFLILAYTLSIHQPTLLTNTKLTNTNDNHHTNSAGIQKLRLYARLAEIDLENACRQHQQDKALSQLLNDINYLTGNQILAVLYQVQIDISLSKMTNNQIRRWLSTLHTVILQDTIVSQKEYDCLTLLAELWLGHRELVD